MGKTIGFLLCVLALNGCSDDIDPGGDEGGSPAAGGNGDGGSGGDPAAGGEGGQGGAGPTMVCANDDGTAFVGEQGSCGGVSIDPACTCNVYGALVEATCPHFISGCEEMTCGTISCGETTVCTALGVCELP